MNQAQTASILQMAQGAIMEKVDYGMFRILENILDVNTNPTAKRKLTLTLELKPDDERQVVTVTCNAVTKLAPTNPVITSLYVTGGTAVEMVPQIPGQFGMTGDVQESPPVLKVISS